MCPTPKSLTTYEIKESRKQIPTVVNKFLIQETFPFTVSEKYGS